MLVEGSHTDRSVSSGGSRLMAPEPDYRRRSSRMTRITTTNTVMTVRNIVEPPSEHS